MTAPRSIGEAVGWLRDHFSPEAARGLRVAYQVELSGGDGGVLSARVRDGELVAAAEPLDDPDVTFHLAAKDFFDVLDGSANPDLLFMADKLRVDGDLSLALKLRPLFAPRARSER